MPCVAGEAIAQIDHGPRAVPRQPTARRLSLARDGQTAPGHRAPAQSLAAMPRARRAPHRVRP